MDWRCRETGCWPPAPAVWLVRAAFLRGDAARTAWADWQDAVGLGPGLDRQSYRLLPQLGRNLEALGIDGPLVGRLKGIHRQTWYANQMLFARVAPVLAAFGQAGIRTMLLKGAALALRAYADCGLRPMDDVDILVPPVQVGAADQILHRLGWRPDQAPGNGAKGVCRHARGYHETGSGRALDLHSYVFHSSQWPGADQGFWQRAVPVSLLDTPTLAMDPTDQLLHVCEHAFCSCYGVVPLYWIADAMAILNGPHLVSWERLGRQARQRFLAVPVNEMLRRLHDELGAGVPEWILARRLPRLERTVHGALTHPERPRGPACRFWVLYAQFVRTTYNRGLLRGLVRFPGYLRRTWQVRGLREGLAVAVRKAFRPGGA